MGGLYMVKTVIKKMFKAGRMKATMVKILLVILFCIPLQMPVNAAGDDPYNLSNSSTSFVYENGEYIMTTTNIIVGGTGYWAKWKLDFNTLGWEYMEHVTFSEGEIKLLPGIYIQDGAGDLVAGTFSTPYVYDWNSDGKKDLLVGQNNQSNGYVSFFENIGTDSSPFFNGSTYVQACDEICAPLNVLAGG